MMGTRSEGESGYEARSERDTEGTEGAGESVRIVVQSLVRGWRADAARYGGGKAASLETRRSIKVLSLHTVLVCV